MIDFNNKPTLKFKSASTEEAEYVVSELLIDGEEIIACFTSMREKVIFTSKRIITLFKSGLTGNKADYTILPYRSITVFSVETHGGFDSDAELDIAIKDLGTIRFELKGDVDIKHLSKLIAEHIL